MSENAVVLKENIEPVTEKKLVEWLDVTGMTKKLLDNEKKMFINIAREFKLNPFKREIHVSCYGEGEKRKMSIITGYEVNIKRAERTGKLDGWEIRTEGSLTDKSLKAVVTIYRKDWTHPFVHEVYYSECAQYNRDNYPTAIWAKQPKFMTKKVAIGQAFRLCFSDDLGGMPYEEAEMPEDPKEEPRNVTDNIPETKPTPEDTKNVNLENVNPEYERKLKAFESINQILETSDPDGYGFFNAKEKELEKAIFETSSITEIEKQYLRLKSELKKRVDNYKPIPFEQGESKPKSLKEEFTKRLANSSTPSMFTEPEDIKEFEDDIPESDTEAEEFPKEQREIF